MKRTKSFRVKAVVVGAALTLLLGAGAASASHGADDGVGHVRHSGEASGQVRNSNDDMAKAASRVRKSNDDKAKAASRVRKSNDDKVKAASRVRKSNDDKAKAASRVRNSVTKAKAVTQVRSSDDGVGHVRHTGVDALGHR
jgi:hypothetical protein